jgi:ABC-type phosphate transport system substrate-binding protein
MKHIIAYLIVIFCGVALVNAQDYKVIVNTGNDVTSITKSDLSKIMLKKQRSWSNGEKVLPADYVMSSPIREKFSSDVHNKSVNAIKSYWQQFVFAGKGSPSIEFDSDDKIIDYVKSNAGAVGYVSGAASPTGVKVLTVN